MDEYRNEFQPLKDVLTKDGFDISTISFVRTTPARGTSGTSCSGWGAF